VLNILTLVFKHPCGERTKVPSTLHFTHPGARVSDHLSCGDDLPLLPATKGHTVFTYPPGRTDLARDAPPGQTRPLRRGKPVLEPPASCCRQRDKVTAPLPQPAYDPATCRAWQAPELPLLLRGPRGTGLTASREAGALPRPTPLPAGWPPPRFRRVLRRQAPPPPPLTRAGTVLRLRDRAAREGRGGH
jgi:hypothetical protein